MKTYRLFFFLILAITVSRCTPEKQWQLQDISGHLPDLQFALTDDAGNPVTARNYQGYTVLLYFGFAGCGAQCPVTLQHLASVLQQLGHDAGHVRVLLVTIDPVHDTPQVLHNYVGHFDQVHITGLTGRDNDIRDIARRYRAAYRPDSLVHGNAVYIFDASGHARLLAAGDDPNENFVHDLRQLAKS